MKPIELRALKTPTKQPLVFPAIFFALGIAIQNMGCLVWNPGESHSSTQTILILFIGASLVLAMVSWKFLSPPWPVLPLVLAAGILWAACRNGAEEGWSPLHLKNLVLRLPQHVVLRGVVRSDPVIREQGVGDREQKAEGRRQNGSVLKSREMKDTSKSNSQLSIPHSQFIQDFELKVSAVKFLTNWEAARGKVMVRLKTSPPPSLEFGQEIEVEGVLDEPEKPRNFGMFDYSSYLERQGIFHTLHATGPDCIRLLGIAEGWGWLFRARKKLSERLTFGIENDLLAVGIIRGTLLGYREDLPRDVDDNMRRTGTLHAFVVSGLRIATISFALFFVLRLLGVPKDWAFAVILPLLTFYVAATGLRASAIRSYIMAAVIMVGHWLRRPAAPLNTLAASVWIILIWDPFQLFDAGAQLSFVVVAALILLSPLFEKFLFQYLEPDPYIPRHLAPKWHLWLLKNFRWVPSLLPVSLAAWIGSFGINLYYFNLISFTSILANLLIVPLAGFSVGLGMASLLLGLIWDPLAICLNITHALLIHLMAWINETLAWLPHGCFYVPQPPVAGVVAGYLLLTGVIFLWLKNRKRKALALGFGGACAVMGAFLAAWLSGDIRVDVLDMGGGQAVLITGPHFERVLLDGGNVNQGTHIVEPFLRWRGVNSIDTLVISQGSAAHYGGISGLLDKVPFHKIIVADAPFRAKSYRSLLDRFNEMKIPLEKWNGGNRDRQNSLQLKSGTLSALWPPPPPSEEGLPWKSNRTEEFGLVLEFNTKFGKCLFAGNGGEKIEGALSSRLAPPYLLLVQGLHGKGDSLTASWLKSASPKIVVLNSAEYPLNAYPSPEIQRRLESSQAKVYRTDQSGGVIIRLNRRGIESRSFISLPP